MNKFFLVSSILIISGLFLITLPLLYYLTMFISYTHFNVEPRSHFSYFVQVIVANFSDPNAPFPKILGNLSNFFVYVNVTVLNNDELLINSSLVPFYISTINAYINTLPNYSKYFEPHIQIVNMSSPEAQLFFINSNIVRFSPSEYMGIYETEITRYGLHIVYYKSYSGDLSYLAYTTTKSITVPITNITLLEYLAPNIVEAYNDSIESYYIKLDLARTNTAPSIDWLIPLWEGFIYFFPFDMLLIDAGVAVLTIYYFRKK